MKGHRSTAALVVLVPLLFLAASCGKHVDEGKVSETQEQQAAPLTVSDLDVGRRVNTAHQIEEATDTFAPRDTLWASVKMENTPSGTRLLTRWVYTEGGAEQIIAEETHTTATSGTDYTSFFIANPAPWPTGSYELRVGADGEIRKVKEFHIQS